MVYVTGDTHGEVWRFDEMFFPDQKDMTRDDVVVILGDFGCVWDKYSIAENQRLNYLEEKPFTICFVDGNHENFDRLYNEFEIVDFRGGKAHKIRENVYHLMRGYIFDFDGQKFFAFGGASSHDIQVRVNHLSWWKQELPSQEEMDRGEKNLEAINYKVDFVITHCLPQTIASELGYFGKDIITEYFDKLLNKGLEFKKWYCGHYHKSEYYQGNYEVFYTNIARVL